MSEKTENRCRLVLVTPESQEVANAIRQVDDALCGGDIASIIVPQYKLDEELYQTLLSDVVKLGQAKGAAVIASGDTRIAGRAGVDGIHVIGGFSEVRSTLGDVGHKWIVGSGGPENKHAALTLGEENPDYVFFGRFGQDTHPEPHKRNLELADWWSTVVEIPCILAGGNSLDHLNVAAATGADFVALSRAVLGDGVDAKTACAQANAVLSTYVFEDEAA